MQHVVPGCQTLGVVLDRPGQPDVLRLDGDARSRSMSIRSRYWAHRPLVDHTGQLQHPVGQRRLAVVDVSDDAEVANLRRRSERLIGETADGISW